MRALVMGHWSLVLGLLVSSCACDKCEAQGRAAYGQSYSGFNPNKKVDGAGSRYNLERMAELPQGANRLQLWVVVSPAFRSVPQEDKVARWFHGGPVEQDGWRRSPDPRLRKLQAECAYNYYTSDNPLFANSGLVNAVGNATPIVCLTKSTGQVVVNLNAKTLSTLGTSGELADLLVDGIEQANPVQQFAGQTDTTQLVRECPDGQCPAPVKPATVPAVVQPSVPEVVPSGKNDALLQVATGVAAAGLALVTLVVGGGAAGFAIYKARNPAPQRAARVF